MNTKTYKEITDLLASMATLLADAYIMFKKKQISEEKLQRIINITNVCIKKCEGVILGRFE